MKPCASKPKRLVFLMGELEFMASAGLRVLIFARQKMGSDVSLYVIGSRGPVLSTTVSSCKTPTRPPHSRPRVMEKHSLPAVLDSLAEIRRCVKEAADSAGIEEARAYQLQLAVDEIATNIISYGYKDVGASAVISISGEMRDGVLVIMLEDRAQAFDPRTMQMPEAEDLAKPLEERTIGGLGIFLATQGVDRFDYRREGDRNLTIFAVRI